MNRTIGFCCCRPRNMRTTLHRQRTEDCRRTKPYSEQHPKPDPVCAMSLQMTLQRQSRDTSLNCMENCKRICSSYATEWHTTPIREELADQLLRRGIKCISSEETSRPSGQATNWTSPNWDHSRLNGKEELLVSNCSCLRR